MLSYSSLTAANFLSSSDSLAHGPRELTPLFLLHPLQEVCKEDSAEAVVEAEEETAIATTIGVEAKTIAGAVKTTTMVIEVAVVDETAVAEVEDEEAAETRIIATIIKTTITTFALFTKTSNF